MTPRTLDRAALAGAGVIAAGAVGLSGASLAGLDWLTPDAANYALVARSLLRGEGFTEPLVPFHPAAYEAVRHLPELHGLLRPLVLVPLFAVLGATPFVACLPALAYVALTALTVHLWGAWAFGRAAGLVGCALVATNVGLPYFALLASDDTGAACWFTVSCALLSVGLTTRRDRVFLAAGVAGALMLLEKPSGIMMGGVFLVPVLWIVAVGPRRVGRWLALLWTPWLGALALYALRNQAAYGAPGFRFGPLGWILRAGGYEGMMQIFPTVPTLGAVLGRLGWSRVLTLVRIDLHHLWVAVAPAWPWTPVNEFGVLAVPRILPMLAGVALVALAWRRPAVALVSAAGTLATVILVGVVWHFELRFLSVLVPLVALWAAAGLVAGMSARRGGPAGWIVRGAAGAVLAWALVATTTTFLGAQGKLARFPNLTSCRPALAWLGATMKPGERLLTFDPWWAAWTTEREAIMIPTGGPRALATIARRYDARWLLAYPMFSRPRTSQALTRLESRPGPLRVERAFEDGTCRVYRLGWAS